MFECCKCGKETNLDPTEETERDGMECPQCGSILCNKCAGWTVSFDEDVCSECAAKNRPEERRQIERWDLVDNAIFSLIEQLNPVPLDKKIDWDTDGVAEARVEIRGTLIRLYCERLKLCTGDEFYP